MKFKCYYFLSRNDKKNCSPNIFSYVKDLDSINNDTQKCTYNYKYF